MIFEFLIMYLIILFIFMFNFRYNNSSTIDEFLLKKDSDAYKGIAILMIVFSHWAKYLLNTGTYEGFNKIIMMSIDKWGIIGVGVFFFLSGYGLSISKKGSQSISFIFDRIVKLYIPSVIIRFVYYAIIVHYSLKETILLVFSLKDPFWFINVILLFYLVFWILSMMKFREKWLIFVVFILCFDIVLFELGFEEQWWNANFCFVFGILLAENKDFLFRIYHDNWKKIFIFGFIGLGLGMFVNMKYGNTYPLFFKTFMLFFIVLMLLGLLIRFKYIGNNFAVIGTESLYVYMVHLLVLKYFKQNDLANGMDYQGVLYFTITLITCIIVSLIFKKYSDLIKKFKLVK